MSVEWINKASGPELERFFNRCCSCKTWVHRMVSGRPYDSRGALFKAADEHWQRLGETDYLQAMAGHPMIGDVRSLEKHHAGSRALSVAEQSGVQVADRETLAALLAANVEYRDRFGFVFIVCATGKMAAEMLALLQARLGNTREEEIRNAGSELRKITRLRLEKLL